MYYETQLGLTLLVHVGHPCFTLNLLTLGMQILYLVLNFKIITKIVQNLNLQILSFT
jgi:hypothetical protein